MFSRRKIVVYMGMLWYSCSSVKSSILHTNLNFITISTGDNPLFGHIASEPGFLAAYNRLKPLYPQILSNSTWHSFYYPGGKISCGDAAVQMQMIAGNIYDLLRNISGFTILLTPGCSLEMMVLGDFAREWDVPLFSSTSGDGRLGNKRRFPTVISGAGATDLISLSLAAKNLIDKYQWKTITFLCDVLSQYPGLNAFFGLACGNTRTELQANLTAYTIYTSSFDSADSALNIDSFLEKVKVQSRGIGFLLHNGFGKKIASSLA